jgi:hypothetical protein
MFAYCSKPLLGLIPDDQDMQKDHQKSKRILFHPEYLRKALLTQPSGSMQAHMPTLMLMLG